MHRCTCATEDAGRTCCGGTGVVDDEIPLESVDWQATKALRVLHKGWVACDVQVCPWCGRTWQYETIYRNAAGAVLCGKCVEGSCREQEQGLK